jgi:hypothetical protein
MQKKLLSLAVASTLVVGAFAHTVMANPSLATTGDKLLGAIYNTEAGNETYVNIVNTSASAKAVKFRMREGRGSEDSLDFHVYLSPYDMWTAALTRNSSGQVVLVTNDTSCTAPFVTNNPDTTGAIARTTYIPSIYGGDAEQRVREGYIEIIEMADFGSDTSRPDDYSDRAGRSSAMTGRDIAWATKHTAGVPNDCASVRAFNVGANTPQTVAGRGFGYPKGGLFGNMAVINVGQGTYLTYEMDALKSGFLRVNGNIFFSQNSLPSSTITQWTADRGLVFEKGGQLNYFDLPDLSTITLAGGLPTATVNYRTSILTAVGELAGKISGVLLAQDVTNEYIVSSVLNASTDWVITFPTKRFHTNYAYDRATGAPTPNSSAMDNSTDGYIFPFSSGFNQRLGEACDPISFKNIRDREERTQVGDIDFSPGRPEGSSICYEMNVVSFNDPVLGVPSRVVGGVDTRSNLNVDFSEGWASLEFPATDGVGLPVIGFMAYNLVNSAVTDGVLANYAGTFNHRYLNR